MKTSKKILSIVLAVMLLVGTIVVGVSADTTMVYEKAGSKLVYTAEASKAANADGVIEVEPGETITVSVYAQANYYFGSTGSEIFCWTAGYFNTIALTDVTNYNYVNNYTCTPKVIASTAATQLGTGYNKGTHEGFQNLRAYSTDCTSPFDASTATLAYTFNFVVPETATIGATGEFLMPETCSATVATTSRQKQIYAAVNNSDTEYNSGTVASIYPETIDLTGTILNFKVVSAAAPEVPCDYTALDAAIAAAATADTTNCTSASVAAFNDALAAAQAVERDLIVDDAGANQAKIDDAAAALNAAIASLTKLGACDYAELDAAIAQAKALDENDYTSTSWYSQAYLTSYLDAAEAVARDMVADEAGENQAIIDNAKDALLAAIAMLELRADFTALKAAIATAATADTANCTAASVAEFDAALAAAQELADSESSIGESRQAEVDAAAERLNAAITGLTKLGNCDYAALDAAIAAYEAKVADKDLYTNWADYEAAYNAAKAVARDMIADEAGANQKVIDDAAAALNAVVLQYKAADYTKVDEAKTAAEAIDASKYTSASVKAVNDAVAAVVEGYDITKQAEVDAMAKAINDAIAALVPLAACDYTALDAAIAAYDALDKNAYTPNSWTASDVDALAAAAKAVARDLIADEAGANQAAINDAAAALDTAIKALVKVADKAALAAAIAAAPTSADAYTPDSWAAADLANVLAAADAVYTDANATQGEVDAQVAAIEAAVDKLVKKADKSALAAAIEAAKALDEDDYTPESWTAADLEAVIAAAETVYDDANATDAAVADAIAALEAAAAKLAEKADKTALKAAIDTLPEVAEDEATSETWAAYEEELAKANAVYADANATQDAVDAAEANLLAAIAGVKALGNCDYTALDAAIATTPEYTEEYYDAEAWAAYEAALAAAKAVERGMLADEAGVNQAKIDDAAKALTDAYDALVPVFVDRSDLEAALALTPAYGAEYYDAAAYLAWQDAVEAGRDSYDGLDGEPDVDWAREEVAAAADAINSAFAKLVPAFIDYSALEEAVKNYGTTPEAAESYTDETYQPYAAALERAQNMLKDKNENAPASDTQLQATIDAAAAELESTFKALELKPVDPPVDPEPALTIVTAVRATEEDYQVGDTVNFEFDCAITNVTKLQIVFSNGSTSTYHRAHSAIASIVDNGDGTETWTIAVKIYYDSIDASARGKLGRVWEDEGCAFKFETKAEEIKEDYSVKSAAMILDGTAVTEFKPTDTVILTVVCGPDTLRIRLVAPDGATTTYDRSRATQDENGNWVWAVPRTFAKLEYKYDIYTAGSSNRLTDEGTDLIFTVKDQVVADGPSTGDDADIVVSAAVAKARLLRDAEQTFTIVTDKDAKGVRVVDQYGNVQTYSKDAATAVDNGDGTLTWTLTVVCTRADTFNCTVDALYGSTWMNNGTTVSYRVVY